MARRDVRNESMNDLQAKSTNTLALCPFCGGEASVKVLEYDDNCKVWGVFCESDLANEYSHGHFVDNYATEAEAIAAWNTRVDYHGYDQAAIEAWESIKAWNSRAERTCYADEVTHRDCKYSVNRGWKERTCKQEERGWGTEGDHARVWLTCGHDCMVPTVQDLPNYCPNCGCKVIGG